MKDSLPTLQEVKRLMFKQQRKKNVIPEHAALTKEYNVEILRIQKRIETAASHAEIARLEARLDEQLDKKHEAEDAYFSSIRGKLENYILDQPTKIRLRNNTRSERRITTFNKRRSTQLLFDRYCAMRLGDSFRVRAVGRDQTIRTLIDALQSSLGRNHSRAKRAIFRFDISDFFGSIQHSTLLEKVESNAGVPRYINNHVRSILTAYSRLYDSAVGIPQGIPTSSVLSEIYLENFDSRLKRDRAVALYLRYVDDIVLICDLSEQERVSELIVTELTRMELQINKDKDFTHLLHPNTGATTFDYLGYCFRFSSEKSQLCCVDISTKKKQRLLRALNNLLEYAESISCWADKRQVNFFFVLSEYLFLPHASEPEGDGLRIVTGLAYNARFVQGNEKRQQNFNTFVHVARAKIQKVLQKLRSADPDSLFCPCCQEPVHQAEKALRFETTFLSHWQIMRSAARPHVPEDTRRRSRRVLWS